MLLPFLMLVAPLAPRATDPKPIAADPTAITAASALLAADPTPLTSRIQDVTLYPGTALVRRAAALTGAGTFVVRGLPSALDEANVRVKCAGGDVVDVQVRRRIETRTADERVQALREKLKRLERDKQVLDGDMAVLAVQQEHMRDLMELGAAPVDPKAPPAKGASGWNTHWQFFSEEYPKLVKAARELTWKLEDKAREIAAAQNELGQVSGSSSVTLHDVVVEVVGQSPRELELEYFVAGTGWQPLYDLRTASDLSSAELTYRARIWQHTGEDWSDVGVALSTAQPQRGAQGPDPESIWLALMAARGHSGYAGATDAPPESRRELRKSRESYKDKKSQAREPEQRPFATVESQGLSVRFQLAQKETIQSRREPTTVLVGAAEVAITPERHCVPALDPTVWLRAKAKNTSPWVLLAGTAAVFFGNDYFGDAEIETIQPGQELTLHLGADPAVTVKREQIEDLVKEPGFLSSRASKIDSWKVHFENHGGVGANPDGSVDVIVRESLPKSKDERVEVELSKSEPSLSKADRWKQDQTDKGFLTWVLRVPKNGKQDLVWQTTITYPKDVVLTRE